MVLIEGMEWLKKIAGMSFRPLTGIMVLINDDYFRFNGYGNLFPSPYGDYGSYRLSCITQMIHM